MNKLQPAFLPTWNQPIEQHPYYRIVREYFSSVVDPDQVEEAIHDGNSRRWRIGLTGEGIMLSVILIHEPSDGSLGFVIEAFINQIPEDYGLIAAKIMVDRSADLIDGFKLLPGPSESLVLSVMGNALGVTDIYFTWLLQRLYTLAIAEQKAFSTFLGLAPYLNAERPSAPTLTTH